MSSCHVAPRPELISPQQRHQYFLCGGFGLYSIVTLLLLIFKKWLNSVISPTTSLLTPFFQWSLMRELHLIWCSGWSVTAHGCYGLVAFTVRPIRHMQRDMQFSSSAALGVHDSVKPGRRKSRGNYPRNIWQACPYWASGDPLWKYVMPLLTPTS